MLDLLWLVLPSLAIAASALLVYARHGHLRVERFTHEAAAPRRRAALPPIVRPLARPPRAPDPADLFASDSLTTLVVARACIQA